MADFIAPVQDEWGINATRTSDYDEPNSLGWRLPLSGAENVPAIGGSITWFVGSRISSRLLTNTGDCWATMSAGNDTQANRAYNFNFADTLDASGVTSIDGIEVQLGLVTTPGNTDLECWLSWGASAATVAATSEVKSNPSVGLLTYGGPTNLWGEVSIAVADVRTTDFGIHWQAQSSTGAGTFRISHAGMKVYYTDTADGTIRYVQQYIEVLGTETVVLPSAGDNRVIVVT